MLKRVIIPILITIFTLSFKAYGLYCSQLFSMDVVINGLKSYPRHEMPRQPYELRGVGKFFTKAEALRAKTFVLGRDGTYPFLITRSGELLISHRLPDPSAYPNRPYLGTHRSLADLYQDQRGRAPDVVFAGELKVVAGIVKSLIDRSGSFHFQASHPRDRGENQRLIEDNEARLTFARDFLGNWGLWNAAATSFNFWRLNYGEEPSARPVDGHLSAKSLSEFELRCFYSASCWAQFETLDSFIRALAVKGGASFLVRASIQGKVSLTPDDSSLLALAELAREGAIDFMANPTVQGTMLVPQLVELIPSLSMELGL